MCDTHFPYTRLCLSRTRTHTQSCPFACAVVRLSKVSRINLHIVEMRNGSYFFAARARGSPPQKARQQKADSVALSRAAHDDNPTKPTPHPPNCPRSSIREWPVGRRVQESENGCHKLGDPLAKVIMFVVTLRA